MMEADDWQDKKSLSSQPHSPPLPPHSHDSDDNNDNNNNTNNNRHHDALSPESTTSSSYATTTTTQALLRRPLPFVRTPTEESEDREMNEIFRIPSPASHRSPLTHRPNRGGTGVGALLTVGSGSVQSPMSSSSSTRQPQQHNNRRALHYRGDRATAKRKKNFVKILRSCLFGLVVFFFYIIIRQAFWGFHNNNNNNNNHNNDDPGSHKNGIGVIGGGGSGDGTNIHYETGSTTHAAGYNYPGGFQYTTSQDAEPNPFKVAILSPQHTHTHYNNGKMTEPITGKDSNDNLRLQQIKEASQTATTRSTQRNQRTKPTPSLSNSKEHDVGEGFEFKLKDSYYPDNTVDVDADDVAETSSLCGIHAQEASKDRPGSFWKKDVLNSSSRVLITGILNPVGFRLAMKLKNQCGVEIMMGIDPMLPNTVAHRLELQKRIATLTTSIPKLVQPITLPFIGLEPLLKQEKTKGHHHQKPKLAATGETDIVQKFQPTHIVHLASYTMEEYHDKDAQLHERTNTDHPYGGTNKDGEQHREDMLYVRSSMASMEHILNSIASAKKEKQPHLTYASSMGVVNNNNNKTKKTAPYDEIFRGVKLSEEILADTYHGRNAVYSVGLRFPNSIYGPWGRSSSPEYQLAEAAVHHHWGKSRSKAKNKNKKIKEVRKGDLVRSANLVNMADKRHDFVFVDDAVDAIIAAMQYRSNGSVPDVFGVSSEKLVKLESAAEIIASQLPGQKAKSDASFEITKVKSPSSARTRDVLKWTPKTKLQKGLVKMVAWHLDKAAPYGAPREIQDSDEDHEEKEESSTALETGYEFSQRAGVETCAPDDMVCHGGIPLSPCASECSSTTNCIPSIFDDVVELVSEVSADCDLVLYTDSLGYNVEDIKLSAEYRDDGDPIVCNFAFVPAYSTIVKTILKRVPTEQYKKFGITAKEGESSQSLLERKHKTLNGHLLYKGWIVIWVDHAVEPLSPADRNLLKLSPGRLFSSTVQHAMYVTENFRVTPSYDDINFLAHETHRKPLKRRSVYKLDKESGKNHKYKLPAEPERRAILLVSPLKHKLKDGESLDSPSTKKISPNEAVKYMQFEIGAEEGVSHDTGDVRVQREFYERLGQFVNKMDMRSPNEPYHRYALKDYIRSRWIVHDLVHEDGRQLRCQWYQEHNLWGTDFDQLSFAHVMAHLDLERRIISRARDDTEEEEHPMHKELCDAHEWYSLGTSLSLSGEDIDEKVADAVAQEEEDAVVPEGMDHYVRIMSEKFMMDSRRQWATHKKRHKKIK